MSSIQVKVCITTVWVHTCVYIYVRQERPENHKHPQLRVYKQINGEEQTQIQTRRRVQRKNSRHVDTSREPAWSQNTSLVAVCRVNTISICICTAALSGTRCIYHRCRDNDDDGSKDLPDNPNDVLPRARLTLPLAFVR